jgi:hypothetical protein
VNEDIVFTIVGLDEAIALGVVEPFHDTGRHAGDSSGTSVP